MNEVRHVLTALKSPARSSANVATSVAKTTWYDVPAPIIVHCREFHEEETDVVAKNEARKRETKVVANQVSDKSTKSSDAAEFDISPYQSDAKSVSNETPDEFHARMNRNEKQRHSTTVELNATTTVETDADGVPTISFSFLRADDMKNCSHDENSDEEVVVLEVDTSDQGESAGNHHLYDFPRSSAMSENNRASLEQPIRETGVIESSDRQDLYDVPKNTLPLKKSREDAPNSVEQNNRKKTTTAIHVSSNRRSKFDQLKRSTRSLKSGRRSYGASDSDGYDAGIASMSGSYSDPECPPHEEETALSVSGESSRSKRLKLQKQRLGKAWGRMRNWLREERTKIGEVVNRHAKLQAVGALSSEVAI